MKYYSKKKKSKPSYELYVELWEILNIYLLLRIDNYIFFQYHKWEIIGINPIDLDILKLLMEYDYKVFKILLFLYWDLEYFLEEKENKKNLIVNIDDLQLLQIKINKNFYSFELYSLLTLNTRTKPQTLWTNLENYGLFNLLLKYDMFSKMYSLNTKYKRHPDIELFRWYKKFNDIISYQDIMELRENSKEKIDSSYYQGYINSWYKEWSIERKNSKKIKYKQKIDTLGHEMDKLFLILLEKTESN